ncbi:MAG: hypothetical protein GY859_04080, partial [Desulfobacterales bacterium]|nr:hypothetical protein [Desulfobacterales bacterium]
VALPYRVTCISLPNQPAPGATGGGFGPYAACGGVSYIYNCANFMTSKGSARQCFTSRDGIPQMGGLGTVKDEVAHSISAKIDNATLSAVGPAMEPIPAAGGDECVQPPPQKPCDSNACESGDCEDTRQNGGSWVNTVLREYNRNDLDLTVKVPGGVLEVRRLFTDGQWY